MKPNMYQYVFCVGYVGLATFDVCGRCFCQVSGGQNPLVLALFFVCLRVGFRHCYAYQCFRLPADVFLLGPIRVSYAAPYALPPERLKHSCLAL